MTTNDPNDPFAAFGSGGAPPQQQEDPFAIPGQADPFAAPAIAAGQWVPHRANKVLTFAILGMVLCFPFGIAAWVMGTRDLKMIAAGEMDPSGRGATMAGKIVGTVATFLNPLAWAVNILSIAAGQ